MGERVRLVLAKSAPSDEWLDAAAHESYAGLRSHLEVLWLPADDFAPPARQRLGFALERVADATDRWLCFDIGGAAVVGSLVAAASRRPCATFVTAADVLGRLLLFPDECAAALSRSQLVACANPALLQPLAIFFPDRLSALLDAGRLSIVRPVARLAAQVRLDPADYVCTTGTLGELDDLSELAERVVAELCATGARRWRHIGLVDSRTVGRLASILALRGLSDAFEATGVCSAGVYAAHVRAARALLKPRGEVDTSLSVAEAERWGVPVRLPSESGAPPQRFDADWLAAGGLAHRLLAL